MELSSVEKMERRKGRDLDGGGGVVVLQSPLSGSFTYIFDASSREWVGSEDGHSLLGMLTRDWIRQCRGVPDF